MKTITTVEKYDPSTGKLIEKTVTTVEEVHGAITWTSSDKVGPFNPWVKPLSGEYHKIKEWPFISSTEQIGPSPWSSPTRVTSSALAEHHGHETAI